MAKISFNDLFDPQLAAELVKLKEALMDLSTAMGMVAKNTTSTKKTGGGGFIEQTEALNKLTIATQQKIAIDEQLTKVQTKLNNGAVLYTQAINTQKKILAQTAAGHGKTSYEYSGRRSNLSICRRYSYTGNFTC
jgi:hypothetical protein